MKVLIIEDETAAAKNLKAILQSVTPDAEVVDVLDTVVDSVEWFKNNPSPDLVFMDIHLSDGDSFKIFDKVTVTSPVIFTTAYDQYALKAFQVNSIDYLLKPIKEEEVRRAVDKWQLLTGADRGEYVERVDKMVSEQQRERQSFLVRFRDKLIPVSQSDISILLYARREGLCLRLQWREVSYGAYFGGFAGYVVAQKVLSRKSSVYHFEGCCGGYLRVVWQPFGS